MKINAKMTAARVKFAIKRGLQDDCEAILDHIDGLQASRYTGIEGVFEAAVLKGLGLKNNRRVNCEFIGSQNYTKDRSTGWIDLFVEDRDEHRSAFEFKAVRMPRLKGSCLFDVGQIANDFLRLSHATKIDSGWIVIFVYGPMVDDCTSSGDLLRRFHNQMFLDTSLCLRSGRLADDEAQRLAAIKHLGWDFPIETTKAYDHEFAVKIQSEDGTKSIGAYCFDTHAAC